MKPQDIKVGKTYVNRGAGRTTRTVIAIGDQYRPPRWWSDSAPPDEPGVLYDDNHGHSGLLYLRSFARWARREK